MKLRWKGHTAIVELPAGISLLEAGAESLLSRLEQFSGISRAPGTTSDPSPQRVILRAKVTLHDETEGWREEITKHLLRARLRQRLERLEKLFEAISRAPVPWIFTSSQHCLGSWWSLALACHYRCWLRSDAWVGFPEFPASSSTPGGLHTFQPSSEKSVVGLWEKKPTRRAFALEDAGFFHLLVDGADWEETISLPSRAAPRYFRAQSTAASLAQFYTSPHYAADLARRFQERSLGFLEARHEGARREIWVDMSHLVPPAACIAALLREEACLVLASPDRQRLREATHLLFDRLLEEIPRAVLERQWERSVRWVAVDPATHGRVVLSWTFDDRMVLRQDARQCVYHRTHGNTAASSLGWGEYHAASPATAHPDMFEYVASRLMRGRVLSRPVGAQKVPVTVFARSHILGVILDLARTGELGLDAIARQLEESGWGFAGRVSFWERFLRMREGGWNSDCAPLDVGSVTISADDWNVVSWRDAVGIIKEEAEESARFPWLSEQISRLIASHLLHLAEELHRHGHTETLAGADLLCREALGFPPSWGTLESFGRREGRERIQRWLRWKDFARHD
jgi:hypothetical protein